MEVGNHRHDSAGVPCLKIAQADGELLVRASASASAVLKNHGHRKLAPWAQSPLPLWAHKKNEPSPLPGAHHLSENPRCKPAEPRVELHPPPPPRLHPTAHASDG